MPKLSSGRHTLASLESAVEKIKQIASQIEHAAVALKQVKDVEHVTIPKETSLVDGVTFLQMWADSARDAVFKEKIRFDKKRGVSGKSDTYTEDGDGGQKIKRK